MSGSGYPQQLCSSNILQVSDLKELAGAVDQLLAAQSRQATINTLNKLQEKDNAFEGK